MGYKFFDTTDSKNEQELTNGQTLLNSFWFQGEFSAAQQNGVVSIKKNGWFAVYLSWLPGDNIPGEPIFPGPTNGTTNYRIEDETGG